MFLLLTILLPLFILVLLHTLIMDTSLRELVYRPWCSLRGNMEEEYSSWATIDGPIVKLLDVTLARSSSTEEEEEEADMFVVYVYKAQQLQ